VEGDLQAYADKLEADQLAPASRCRKLAAIKSLFGFAHKIGYLQFDVGRPVRVPGVRDTLAERILTEVEITRMIALEIEPRNHALLLCLYGSGVRVSELCGLRWKDCVERNDGGQITVMGKRDKTRTVLLPPSVWSVIVGLRGERSENDPVFRSRQGGPLTRSQVWRIVRRSAKRAGIKKNVSPHFCRHAHGSHALDHGAPISLVQATLGHSSVATTGRYLHARPNDSSSKYLPL
jgi:integrase/recombinase XerD